MLCFHHDLSATLSGYNIVAHTVEKKIILLMKQNQLFLNLNLIFLCQSISFNLTQLWLEVPHYYAPWPFIRSLFCTSWFSCFIRNTISTITSMTEAAFTNSNKYQRDELRSGPCGGHLLQLELLVNDHVTRYLCLLVMIE